MGRPCLPSRHNAVARPPSPDLAALRRQLALEVLDEVLAGLRGLPRQLSTPSLMRLLAERLESEEWLEEDEHGLS